jgi:hypothetical protein
MVRRGFGVKLGHDPPGWTFAPGLFAGASFGDRFRVMPIAEGFRIPGGGYALALGVNLEFHALDRETAEPGWLH